MMEESLLLMCISLGKIHGANVTVLKYLTGKLTYHPLQDIHALQALLDFYCIMDMNDHILLFPKNGSEVVKLWATVFCQSIVSSLNNVSH